MPLGSAILNTIAVMNDTQESPVLELPVYDKSAHGGQGDRSDETVKVRAPLDVVIWEGWCLGFGSLEPAVLGHRYAEAGPGASASAGTAISDAGPYFTQHSLEHIGEVNNRLATYNALWWNQIDAFVQLAPTPPANQHAEQSDALETVFAWRLQAERAMKERNGGKGMSDEAVRVFVAR